MAERTVGNSFGLGVFVILGPSRTHIDNIVSKVLITIRDYSNLILRQRPEEFFLLILEYDNYIHHPDFAPIPHHMHQLFKTISRVYAGKGTVSARKVFPETVRNADPPTPKKELIATAMTFETGVSPIVCMDPPTPSTWSKRI